MRKRDRSRHGRKKRLEKTENQDGKGGKRMNSARRRKKNVNLEPVKKRKKFDLKKVSNFVIKISEKLFIKYLVIAIQIKEKIFNASLF